MKILKTLALATCMIAATPSFAQDQAEEAVADQASSEMPELRRGMLLMSADGRRVGRIDRVLGDENAPTAVTVIKGMKIVTVPADTLSASDRSGRVVTSLDYRDIR